MNVQDHLQELREGYTKWLGPPEETVTMRRAVPDQIAPDVIDVLIFLPMEGPNEDDITTVATAGMSSLEQGGPYPRMEIAIEVKGRPQQEARKLIARNLADLASVPFREKRPFHANMVLHGIKVHPFDRMTFGLLSKWDVLQDVKLPGLDPPVYVLRLTPLYEREADLAEKIGDARALSRLQAGGMVGEDFERGPAEV